MLAYADAEILTAARRIAGSPSLALQAINFYVGTQKDALRKGLKHVHDRLVMCGGVTADT